MLAVILVFEPAVIDELRVVALDLVYDLLLVRDLGVGVVVIVESENAGRLLLNAAVEAADEDARLLCCCACIQDIARLAAAGLEDARFDRDDHLVDVACKRVVGHVSTDVLDVEFLVRLVLDIAEDFSERVR